MMQLVTMAMWMTTAAAPAGWPMPAQVPLDVRQAHADYLAGDWEAFSVHLREALAAHDADPVVERNLLDLLDAAFAARKGQALPVDWKLPEEVERLKISVKRKENARSGSLWFRLELWGQAKRGTVENLRVERYPNQLVLDRRSGLGEWELTPGDHGGDELWAGGECGPTAPRDGLYLLTVKVVGQPEVKGWFVLNHHASSASPYFLAPAASATATATPTFRWDDFRSPEHQRWEERSSSLLVFDPNWNILWSAWVDDAATRELTVGGPEGEGADSLKPGRYEAVLKFQERRRFGRLSVARDSATSVWFDVSPR